MENAHVAAGAEAPAFLRWLARIELALVGVILLISLAITLTTIVERNLGHSTGDWSLKLPELMLGWMTYIGMGALVTERGHVAADMFLRLAPPRWQRFAEALGDVIIIVVLVVIIAGAVSIVRQQLEIGTTDEELNDFPTWILLSILPFGFGLTVLHLLADIWLVLRRRVAA